MLNMNQTNIKIFSIHFVTRGTVKLILMQDFGTFPAMSLIPYFPYDQHYVGFFWGWISIWTFSYRHQMGEGIML